MELKKMKLLTLYVAVCISAVYSMAPKKIIRGDGVNNNELPYQVSLHKGGVHICGGSIIGSIYILTAAHCVVSNNDEYGLITEPREIQVIAGIVNTRFIQPHNVFGVDRVIVHPAYRPRTQTTPDIAVLRTSSLIPLDKNLQLSIGLPNRYPFPGETVTVSGWGVAHWWGDQQSSVVQQLQKLQMKIVPLQECAQKHPFEITEAHICAMSTRDGAAACKGDSGGPLVLGNELVGIVSWGDPCARGTPDVFTSVFHYKNWILSVTPNPFLYG